MGGTSAQTVASAAGQSALQIIVGLGNEVDQHAMLLGGVCYFLGICIFFSTIMKLVALHDGRHSQSKGGHGAVLVGFVVATVFIAIPSAMQSATESLFNQATDMAYSGSPVMSALGLTSAMAAVLKGVKLMGWIAFVRGWLLLRAASEGRVNSHSSGIIFIVAGIFAANIVIFASALQTSTGIQLL